MNPKKSKPKITEAAITYEQESDDLSDTEENMIELKTQDAGGGKYIVIKTHRWALDIDEIDDFAESLKKVVRMAES